MAEDRNFTTAAARLFVSQQSLSEHIKKLEIEMGTPLIIRNRPLELTKAGDIFVAGAREILRTKDRIVTEISDLLEAEQTTLKLAISTVEAPPLMPDLLSYFRKNYPNVNIEVVKRQRNSLPEMMEDISFYFDFAPLISDMDHIYFIHSDFYVVVCRQSLLQRVYPDNWEVKRNEIRRTGDLTLLRELPFSVYQTQTGNISQFTQTLFDSFGIDPRIAFRSDNGELNAMFCLNGSSAVVGGFFYERARFQDHLYDKEDPLLLLPLRTRRNAVPLALSYKKNKQFHGNEVCFISSVRSYLTEYNKQFNGTIYSSDRIPPSFIL